MNARSSLRELTAKCFLPGSGHLLKKSEKQIISSCPPLQLSSPEFLEKIAKIWRDHSRSIRQIPCTLQSSTWAAEENWHSRRSEENEGNARLAAKLNIIIMIIISKSDSIK